MRGVPVRRVSAYRGQRTIIGGGDLIGYHTHGSMYQPDGPHLLNAVGARGKSLRSVFAGYSYRSARDVRSAEIIGGDCHLVPCPATLIEPIPFSMACAVPRFGPLRTIGEYIVIHARPELYGFANGETEYNIIAIEPAPYAWTTWEAAGWLLPMTHSPELIAAVVAGSQAVVTLSLHLSIFALSCGVPFCCPIAGGQHDKVRGYWERAGLPEVMYTGEHPVAHALTISEKIQQVRASERKLARLHLDAMAEKTR
jgi:hypothetical protein